MNQTNEKKLDYRVEKEIYKYFIRDYANKYLEKSPKGDKKAYVCPFCGSGKGTNGTGAFSIDPKTNLFKCFSCDTNGDIYKLIQQVEGIGTFKEQLQRARELYGAFTSEITGDEYKMAKIMERVETQANTTYNNTQQGSYKTVDERKQRIEQIQAERRNNATTLQKHANNGYLLNSQENLFDGSNKRLMDYLENERKLNRQTIINAFIGYDEDEDCLILPANTDRDAQYSYYVRHYPGNREMRYKNADSEMYGTPQIYNVNALYESKPCYICEGIYDAISIMQTYPNANAIALYGTSNIKKLEDELLIAEYEGREIKAPLIACMDNDEPGKKANCELMAMLEKHKQKPIKAKFNDKYSKDVNEMLIKNGDQLKKDILKTCKLARRNKSDQCNLYDYYFNGGYEEDREYFRAHKDRKTGYENIDEHFTTFPGLLALGGIAGLGKTTFAMNLAMNMIETQGQSVMYFALEQGKIDILNKIMARTLHINALDGANQQQYKTLHEQNKLDLTNLQIKKGQGYNNPLLKQSSKEWFTQYGERIEVIEADFNFTADDIKQRVERYIEKHDVTPIVIIDYLQLIAPPKGKGTDKREGIDEVVKALKSLQRKHDLFMIVISNFNRANYTDQVSYESFKETGMIEYTADYVWGLQLAVLGTEEYQNLKDTEKSAKKRMGFIENTKEVKPVALVSLKNRHGLAGWKAYFDFVASHDYFKEVIDPRRIEEYEFDKRDKEEKRQSKKSKKNKDQGHALKDRWGDEEIGEENLEGVLDCSVVVDGIEVKTDINGKPTQNKRNTKSKK